MSTPQSIPFRAVMGRATWMFFGPMLLLFATVAIATRSQGSFSFSDLVYFLVLAAMLAGRWVEYRSGAAQTATGEPATWQHLRRYTLSASVLGLVVWGAATLFRTFG